ncbi:hypothetical protein [Streptomyces sp. NPDC094031]|uniref:hypothetical protein n=1 Tax=Streptomyces sp. NPDC094031 TaxID=3155307 RepID=UPI003333BCC1
MTAADRRFEREFRRDKDLARWWYRVEFFEWLIDDDPENLQNVVPDDVDEEVLDRDRTSMWRVVAPWLARGLLERVGCYADAERRRTSRLPVLLVRQADTALAELAQARDSSPGDMGYLTPGRARAAAELYQLAWDVTCAVRQEQHASAAPDLPRAA